MSYSNSEILASVLNKYIQPIIAQFAEAKMSTLPSIQSIENKIRSTGWVTSNWSITRELSPLIEPFSGVLVKPLIRQYLKNVPDEAIPEMAHNLVDKAIENGGLDFMEGRLQIEIEDLEELKKLLEYNLPFKKGDEYEVLTEPPIVEKEVSDGTTNSKIA